MNNQNARSRTLSEARGRLALPKAICRLCGRTAAAGTGTRDPEPFYATTAAAATAGARTAGLPPIVDSWRRHCSRCASALAHGTSEAEAISGILGSSVPQADARLAIGKLRGYVPGSVPHEWAQTIELPTAEATRRWTGKPWGHVTSDERERVRRAVADVVRERTVGRCTAGACGLCGVAEALTWHAGPYTLRWPDSGTSAPLCDACARLWTRRGEPTEADELARVVVEACTGWALPLGHDAPSAVRAFAMSTAADRAGLTEPWAFSPAIADLRRNAWTVRPDLAPADMREHAEAWHREEREHHAMRDAAQRAERDAVTAAHW